MNEQISLGFPNFHWTVSELTQYVRELIDSDNLMQDVSVTGELSNVSCPKSGHTYFSLKDSESVIQCVIWRSVSSRSVYLPVDGDKVMIQGYVSIYPAGGRYQLYVSTIKSIGTGDLLLQTEMLKEKLDLEGLFNQERKTQLPEFPTNIVIITSPDAAAYHDMLNVIARRWPIANIKLVSTIVQGPDAPQEIIEALDIGDKIGADVILMGRGGGSPDDLMAFNSENVVRAVADTITPLVTGIGHETDFTLVDFAADVRAPTPSVAAEISTPDYRVVYKQINVQMERASEAIFTRIRNNMLKLDEMGTLLRVFSPANTINHERHRLLHVHDLFLVSMRDLIIAMRLSVNKFEYTLLGLKPTETLNRGYSIITRTNSKKILTDSNKVARGELLNVIMSKGKIIVKVVDIVSKEHKHGG